VWLPWLQAVKVMTHICRESEASLDYYSLFRGIMKRTPLPMSPLESLASSAVRTAHKVQPSPIPCSHSCRLHCINLLGLQVAADNRYFPHETSTVYSPLAVVLEVMCWSLGEAYTTIDLWDPFEMRTIPNELQRYI
jgi:hypothetical protein